MQQNDKCVWNVITAFQMFVYRHSPQAPEPYLSKTKVGTLMYFKVGMYLHFLHERVNIKFT